MCFLLCVCVQSRHRVAFLYRVNITRILPYRLAPYHNCLASNHIPPKKEFRPPTYNALFLASYRKRLNHASYELGMGIMCPTGYIKGIEKPRIHIGMHGGIF